MTRGLANFAAIWLILSVAAAPARPQQAPAIPMTPDELLWRQIEPLKVPVAAAEPFAARFDAEVQRLDRLISRLASYQRQFPGGGRYDEAIALELGALFHLATLVRSSERLARRCEELRKQPMNEPTRARVEYFAQIATRLAEGPALLASLRAAPAAGQGAAPAAGDGPSDQDADSPPQQPGRFTVSGERVAPAASREGARSSPFTRVRTDAIGAALEFDAAGELTAGLRAAGLCQRPVVVLIWASWDEPSLAAATSLRWLRALHPDLGTLCVSIDLDATRMQDAVDAYALEGPCIRLTSGWASPLLTAWGLRRLPAMLLIDSHGVLRAVAEDVTVADLAERLNAAEPR
ncbi:MAG: hypothetical protein AMXMBFR47_04960 [Planctomycetota bacterium]